MTGQSSSQAATPIQWWKPALFFLVVIAGLWYVKWEPYYEMCIRDREIINIAAHMTTQRHHGSLIATRCTTQPQIDSPRIERIERAELFGDHQW